MEYIRTQKNMNLLECLFDVRGVFKASET